MVSFPPNPTEKLDLELDLARQLSELLKDEQEQLIKANIDALGSLLGKKSALIARIRELGKARLNALAQAEFTANEAGMQKWFDSPFAQSLNKHTIKKTWNELHTMLRSTKELNRTNGLLIGSHMSRTQAALQVLQNNHEAQVYGKTGHTSVQTSKRSLVIG